MNKIVFKLFANCIPVKGYSRSAIYDLERQEYKFIPNILHDILKKHEGESIDYIKEYYSGNDSYIDKYFTFLDENDYIFYCDKKDVYNFPPLNLNWDYPAHISNAIIQIYSEINIDLKKVFFELSDLGCKNYIMHFEKQFELSFISEIIDKLKGLPIRTVDIYMPCALGVEDSINELLCLCNENIIINNIILYNSNLNKCIQSNSKVRGNIFFSTLEKINYNIISQKSFAVNTEMFTEAQKHNTFFNRKAIISSLGYVKNSILKDTYKWELNDNTSISRIVKSEKFKKNWFICKDKIDICLDCEYRYMCVDARDPIQLENNFYTFNNDIQCPYNPYIAKWQGQEGWISVEQWRAENTDWEEKAIQNRTQQQKKPQTV